jgi:hypothetical protein
MNTSPTPPSTQRHESNAFPDARSFRLLLAIAAIASTLFCLPRAAAQTMTDITADAQVASTSTVSTTADPMDCGFSGSTGMCPVFVFQLPTLPSGQAIATATFESYCDGKDGTPTFNGDLYGLTFRASSSVLTTDYYAGALDTSATLLEDNYAPTSLANSGAKLYCSSNALTNYLNEQYQNGGAGKYIFVRVSPDQVLTSNYTRYKFQSAEYTGGSYYWATISYTTAPASNNVAVGGGGAVTGIMADPTTPGRFYMRTDVGGAFRWDVGGTQWIPITEAFPYSFDGNDFGIESLGVDPNNAGTIYAYTGKFDYSSDPGHLYKSTDAGGTWTALSTPTGLKAYANQGDHSRCGEKLGVDPNNSSVVYLASFNVGLWKSIVGGGSWTQVMETGTTPFPLGQAGNGLSFVAFDKGGGLTGGASSIFYVGVVDTTGGTGGVWKTTNGGTSWSLMTGGLTYPCHGVVGPDGTFYVTFINNGGVCKAIRTATALTNCAPSSTIPYGALAVDPTTSQNVYVSEYLASQNSPTYMTSNGGASWTLAGTAKGTTHTATRDSGWWFDHISQIAINPANTKEVWMADWFGVLQTPDITTTTVGWNYLYAGDEETCPQYIATAPSGVPLMIGEADIEGMYLTDPDVYPTNSFIRTSTPTNFGSTTGLDFCETNTNFWARVDELDGGGSTGYYSTNDGAAWTAFATTPSGQTGGRIAVSATNTSNMVWKADSGAVYYTTNGGSTWSSVTWTGGTSPSHLGTVEFICGEQQLCSNRVTGGTFYLFAYTGTTGQIWSSTNSGANWSLLSTVSMGTVTAPTFYKLAAMPGNASELWLAIQNVGVFQSTNGGTTFNLVTGTTSGASVAFGAPAPGHVNPTVFLWGKLSGTSSFYRSDDDGVSWNNVIDPTAPANNEPYVMEADRQTFGRYYIGTNGRGTYIYDSN